MASNEKCGNVFLTHKGLIFFHCVICKNKYDKIQNFGIHIIDKHYTPDDDFEVDDLLPAIPEIMLEECSSNAEILNDFNFETDEEDSESNSSPFTKIEEIEQANDDQRGRQCGEVDLTQEGMLIFRCTLCEKIYEGVREFDKHVICEHYSSGALEKFQFETLWSENDIKNTNFEYSEGNNDRMKSTVISEQTQQGDNEGEISRHVDQNIIQTSSAQKVETTEKPVPKWKQVFEIIKCPIDKVQKYKCKLCGVVIRDKSNTQHHIKRVHEHTKPHKCSECPKEFHSRSELRIHFRKHTGERPYLCMECGVAFISASELHMHRETKHKKHIRDKICPICSKSFYTSKHLRAHRSVHSEDRPFNCRICHAGFKVKTTLKTHMRIHEDKRQYKCNLCPSSYNYKSILISHMKTKHALALDKS